MRIVIVGCGKVGTSIASQLNAEGHDIVVVDIDRNAVQIFLIPLMLWE